MHGVFAAHSIVITVASTTRAGSVLGSCRPGTIRGPSAQGSYMKKFVSIDGIPGGWVAEYLRLDGRQRFAYAKSAARLLADHYDRAMIDMPIGLPERGYRQCDIEARALVGPRVFLGARWGLWNFKTLDEANLYYWSEEGIGRGISMELFCFREKLQELNEAPVPPDRKST